MIISHAHGDHDQGAAELQRRYGAKVVMGAPDWDSTLQRPATAAGGVPKRDVAVGPEGTKITLGDTTVTVVPTPGHTPGTLSYVFPVKDQGRTVTVAYSGGTLTGAFGTDGARWDEYVASQRKIAKAAADAGVGILFGTDSPQLFSVPGFSIHREARLLAAAGLTPFQILAAGTRNVADFYGARDEFGTVTPGRRADLILLDENPLADVTNLRRRAGVMVAGRWLPETEIQRRLEEIAARP